MPPGFLTGLDKEKEGDRRQKGSQFKLVEFDQFRNDAGSNYFVLSPKKWIDTTNAIGITSKSGKYGGTFAHFKPGKL